MKYLKGSQGFALGSKSKILQVCHWSELITCMIILMKLWARAHQCQVLHKDATLSIRKIGGVRIWERKRNSSIVLGVMMEFQHPKHHLP